MPTRFLCHALLLAVAGLGGVDCIALEGTAQTVTTRQSLSEPARNTIYSCDRERMSEALARPWVDALGVVYFDRKPVVEGAEQWASELDISQAGDEHWIVVIAGK